MEQTYKPTWYYNIMKIYPKNDNRPKTLLYKNTVKLPFDAPKTPQRLEDKQNIKI